jgi:putative nucleotidyltransferase with HDIG domain
LELDAEIVTRVRAGRVQVPPYPAAAMKLMALLSRADFSQQELLDVVKMDQVLAGVILRLANSAAYQRGGQVTELSVAVARVGAREVQSVAMASGLQAHASNTGPLAPLRRRAWIEALTSARVAELLATIEGANPGISFLAGLLHDIGKNLVIACLEDIITSNPSVPARTEQEWWSIVERFHVELGLVLAASWRLADDFTQVISEHHQQNPSNVLVGRISLADDLVAVLMARPGMSTDELRQLLGISIPAADRLAAGICALPDFIRAFEADLGSAHPEPQSMVRAESSPEPGEAARRGLVVAIAGASPQAVEGTLWSATAASISVKVGTPLRTNVLVRVRFPGHTTESFCAKIKACSDQDGVHIATLCAFSLSGVQLQQWNALVLAPA